MSQQPGIPPWKIQTSSECFNWYTLYKSIWVEFGRPTWLDLNLFSFPNLLAHFFCVVKWICYAHSVWWGGFSTNSPAAMHRLVNTNVWLEGHSSSGCYSQFDIRTCTAQIVHKTFRWCCDHLHQARKGFSCLMVMVYEGDCVSSDGVCSVQFSALN